MEDTIPSPDERLELKGTYVKEEPPVNGLPKEIQMFEIAGFWRRFLAFVLDGLVLGIPVTVMGFIFRDFAFYLGPWGRLIGFGIIFLYWSYSNSILRNGQTIGKQLMKITVVDRNGAYLSPGKTMLRAGVLVFDCTAKSVGIANIAKSSHCPHCSHYHFWGWFVFALRIDF